MSVCTAVAVPQRQCHSGSTAATAAHRSWQNPASAAELRTTCNTDDLGLEPKHTYDKYAMMLLLRRLGIEGATFAALTAEKLKFGSI